MKLERIDAPANISQFVSERPITNFMFLIWKSRKDLQQAFDLKTPEGQQRFIGWFDLSLEREYGMSPVAAGGSRTDREGRLSPCASGNPRPAGLWSHLSRAGKWLPVSVRGAAKKYLRFLAESRRHDTIAVDGCSPAPVVLPGSIDREPDRGDPGVNLVGYAHAELGMGEHVRMSAAALAGTGVPYGVVNFQIDIPSRKQARLHHGALISTSVYGTNLFHINADQMLTAFCHLGRDFFSDRYNIGYWLWELSLCPDEWLPVMGLVDEIWAPSRFIQKAFAERTDLPVEYMPLCVQLPPLKGYDRQHYGLPEDRFLFLFAFDFYSFMDRKNPFAVISAFKQAFPNRDKDVGLVIKIMNGDPGHPRWNDMCDLIGGDPRVFIFNKVMDRDEVVGLIDVCNCFVSLHRSEGFGFGPAEAMYLGKPVIVTNYSGNTDFTRPDNACLVDYRLIPVQEGQYVFFNEGQVWADPDIEQAAWYMKKLVKEPSYGVELGKKAAGFIRGNHSPQKIGSLYRKRLMELNLVQGK